jgi:hypothetical protein
LWRRTGYLLSAARHASITTYRTLLPVIFLLPLETARLRESVSVLKRDFGVGMINQGPKKGKGQGA